MKHLYRLLKWSVLAVLFVGVPVQAATFTGSMTKSFTKTDGTTIDDLTCNYTFAEKEDGKLSVSLTFDQNVVGMVPRVYVNVKTNENITYLPGSSPHQGDINYTFEKGQSYNIVIWFVAAQTGDLEYPALVYTPGDPSTLTSTAEQPTTPTLTFCPEGNASLSQTDEQKAKHEMTLSFTYTFKKPAGESYSTLRIAAVNLPATGVEGVTYNRWLTTENIIYGETRITNPDNRNGVPVSLTLKNVPDDLRQFYIKGRIIVDEENGHNYDGPVYNLSLSGDTDAKQLSVTLNNLNISDKSVLFDMPAVEEAVGMASPEFQLHRVFYYREASQADTEENNIIMREFDKINTRNHVFDYTQLKPETEYTFGVKVSTGVINGERYEGKYEVNATTLSESKNTHVYGQSGYFKDGTDPAWYVGGGVHPCFIINTVTELAGGTFYLTQDTDRNGYEIKQPVSKVIVHYTDGDGNPQNYDLFGQYFDHFTFLLNPDGQNLKYATNLRLQYYTDYVAGGQSIFDDIVVKAENDEKDDDLNLGAPVAIEWLEFAESVVGKNQTRLTTSQNTTTLHAVVVDAQGNYLVKLPVSFEYADDATAKKHGADGYKAQILNEDNTWTLDLTNYTTDKSTDIHINAVYEPEVTPDTPQEVASRAAGDRLTARKTFAYNDTPTSITSIDSDAGADSVTVFYNLSGIRIDRPETGTVVIMVKGGKASKVLIK